MSNTFVLIYSHLKLGGIEKNIIDLFRSYHQLGYRIVWLKSEEKDNIFEPWIKTLQENAVEIVPVSAAVSSLLSNSSINFDAEEVLCGLAFTPLDFFRLYCLLKQYPNRKRQFWLLPNFAGRGYYLEEYFPSFLRSRIRSVLSPIYRRMYKNGNLLFFNARHEEEMHARYGLECLEDREHLFVKPFPILPFNEQLALERADRNPFTIVTCGRFEFPHKGYMFGLVDTFAELKKSDPDIRLLIAGYGAHESLLREKVQNLGADISKDITFLGAVSPSEMVGVFDRSSVNVACAGALLDGARAGLVSLAARHFSYSCEVYGWFNSSNSGCIHDEPGQPLYGYLKELIEMDREHYIRLCKDSYDATASKKSDMNWLFTRKIQNENILSKEDHRIFLQIFRYVQVERFVKKCLRFAALRLGLYDTIVRVRSKKPPMH